MTHFSLFWQQCFHFLIPVARHNFRKIIMNKFRERLKIVDFKPKNISVLVITTIFLKKHGFLTLQHHHRVLVLKLLQFYCCKLYLGTWNSGDNCNLHNYFICFDYPQLPRHVNIISVATIESMQFFFHVLMVESEVFSRQFCIFILTNQVNFRFISNFGM